MSDYLDIEKEVLIALLMNNTQKLVKMISSGIYGGPDFTNCKETIMALQNEIKKHNSLLSGNEPTPFLNPEAPSQSPDAAA